VGVSVSTRRFSVVIADRYPLVLCGLSSALLAESEFEVVATCRDGTRCIEAIRDLSPDLALLDISLPPVSGLQVLAAINAEHFRTRIVFLAASLKTSAGVTAIAGGAYGVIPQDATPQLLARCLRKVASGQRLLPIGSWDSELRNGHKHGSPNAFGTLSAVLSERERQIIHLVGEGLSNKEVGRQLNLADGTIKVHLHRIYQKLAIHNRTVLAVLAKGDLDGVWSPHDAVPEGINIHLSAQKMKVPMSGLSARGKTNALG
jgi:two-component system nitrate/nitrite response regulator NarL